ncbi:hypothetical protein ES319_D03G054700v1 [Gossypium barbadense]|uniref:Uncharacterized protein n=2 Tax=Gossypium TaxID=3633 RepID=A0A5J5S0M6_GOSBA|nr:hypothetical protein ES319_D03G054700v1 [Gossypium barbadense]TYG75778.1 hypothetical protein ES288_D03G060200v1 [Gossypium darwinii]
MAVWWATLRGQMDCGKEILFPLSFLLLQWECCLGYWRLLLAMLYSCCCPSLYLSILTPVGGLGRYFHKRFVVCLIYDLVKYAFVVVIIRFK